MTFLESKRQENLNRISLEYQQSLININNSKINDSKNDEEKNDNEGDNEQVVENINVYVSGAVLKEGLYELMKDSTVADLLDKAGINSDYDVEAINLNYILSNNDNIYVPFSNNGNKISINTADETSLDMLPSIGPTLAKRIIEYRNSNGLFRIY